MPHNGAKGFWKICEYTISVSALDRHLYRARRVPGRRRHRPLLAVYILRTTDAHAPGRRSPGRPVRLPSLRASPLDGLGDKRASCSAEPRFSTSSHFISAKATAQSQRSRAFSWAAPALCSSCFGEMFYVTEGQQRALICIPLSAAMSEGLYLLICLLPSIAVALTAICVLPFLALLCLQKSLAEIEADVTAPLAPAPATPWRLWQPMPLRQYPRVFVEAHRWHRAGPKLRRRRGARQFRQRPFGGGPRLFLGRASTFRISARCSSRARSSVAELLAKGHRIGHRRQAVHLGKHHPRPRQKHLTRNRHSLPPGVGRPR